MSYPFPWGRPPPGYVPGLGRGAVGFVTCIENGIVDFESDAPITSKKKLQKMQAEDDRADAFYREIDARLKARNRPRAPHPPTRTVFDEIRNKFSDLRPALQTISANDWAMLPEIGATTYHRPKWELYAHASDRTIVGDFDVDDVTSVSRSQRSVLTAQLSRAAPDVGELTAELDVQAAAVVSQIDDLDRAADLYRTLTHTNKPNAQGWFFRGRVEEKRGRLAKARQVARDGMLQCPESELLVVEAARLSGRADAVAILEAALRVNHATSERLWLQLAAYQVDAAARRSVFEEALKRVPTSERLWRAAIAGEPPERHMEILRRAVGCAPTAKQLWIDGCQVAATFDEAMFFVENGIRAVGECVELCIACAQACERFGEVERIEAVLRKAVSLDLEANWVAAAQKSEGDGFGRTARILIGVIPFDESFAGAAATCESRNFMETASELLQRYANDTHRFGELLQFESRRGNLREAISRLVEEHPTDESLMQEIADVVDFAEAIPILEGALVRMPTSEAIITILMDSYLANKQVNKAQDFALSVREFIQTSIPLSIRLARINELLGGGRSFLEDCIRSFPHVPEFWLLLVRNSEDQLAVLKSAVAACPNSAAVHIELLNCATRLKLPKPRIRALLERARQACRDDALIWLVSSEFEEGSRKSAILEEAKSSVADVGLVWARQVELVIPENRFAAAKQALETLGHCRELVLIMGICLWRNGALDQARATFENMNRENQSWGDGWVFRMKFEQSVGGDVPSASAVVRGIRIRDGFLWRRMRDDPGNFQFDPMELLDELVQLTPDPMVAEVSIFGGLLQLG
jgi:pre-mRNA-processing factor 6